MDLVSVIIPVYNKEKYLKDSILSVLNQTYSNIEVIIINDGSTDNSEKIILNLQDNDNRIKYFSKKNEGVSSARNDGITYSKGNYITFMDADDYYDKDFVSKMVAKIQGFDVCYCGYNIVTVDKNNRHILKKARVKFLRGDILEAYLLNITTAQTNSWMFRRDFLQEQNLMFSTNLSWGEDSLFFSKVLTINVNIQCVPEYLTFYNQGVTGALSSDDINKVYQDIQWIHEYFDFLNTKHLSLSRREKAINAIKHYRLPALITYRLYAHKINVDSIEFIKVYNDLKKYVNDFKFNNGFRSLKLYFYKCLLKL